MSERNVFGVQHIPNRKVQSIVGSAPPWLGAQYRGRSNAAGAPARVPPLPPPSPRQLFRRRPAPPRAPRPPSAWKPSTMWLATRRQGLSGTRDANLKSGCPKDEPTAPQSCRIAKARKQHIFSFRSGRGRARSMDQRRRLERSGRPPVGGELQLVVEAVLVLLHRHLPLSEARLPLVQRLLPQRQRLLPAHSPARRAPLELSGRRQSGLPSERKEVEVPWHTLIEVLAPPPQPQHSVA